MNAGIRQWPEESLERKAYNAAATIPAAEQNDTNRLGYHVYLYLKGEIRSLADAVHVAQANMLVDREEVVRRLAAELENHP